VQPPEPEVRLARSQVQPATTPVVRIERHEFKEMLGEAGFTGIRVTSDWQDNCAPGPGNEDWTFHDLPRHSPVICRAVV
jgi:hypothetical protein